VHVIWNLIILDAIVALNRQIDEGYRILGFHVECHSYDLCVETDVSQK